MSFTALGVLLPGAALGRSADEFNSLAIDCSVQLASRQALIVAITDCSPRAKGQTSHQTAGVQTAGRRHCPEWLSRGVKRRRSSNENCQSRPFAKQIQALRGPASPCRATIENKRPRTQAVFELWQPYFSKRIEATAQLARQLAGGPNTERKNGSRRVSRLAISRGPPSFHRFGLPTAIPA